MIESLIEWMSHQNPALIYFSLFLSIIIEYVFPPFPGDTILLLGGVLVNQGVINLPMTFLVNILGSLIGVTLLYKLGYSKGRRFFQKRQGRIFSPEKMAKVEALFAKHGTMLLIANRFLVSLRTLILIFSGIARKPVKEVLIYTTLGVTLWVAAVLSAGILLGASLKRLQEMLSVYSQVVYFLVFMIFLIVFLYSKFFRNKKEE